MIILIDSNIIIYAASGKFPALADWMAEQHLAVSAISVLEVLGYHKLHISEKKELENLFAQITVLYPGAEVFRLAIKLRQERRISIGDALIAATALNETIALATHNTVDFPPGLTGLKLLTL